MNLLTLAALAALGSGCLLVPTSLAADEPLALSRLGDGAPVCGLGKEFHAGRRAALRRSLGSGLIVVRGLPETRDYAEFRQDKTFWYLTGIESPDATLVMDATNGMELLFVPARNAVKESWEGEVWDSSDEWVREITGFKRVLPAEQLMETLDGLLDEGSECWVSLHPTITLSGCFDRGDPADARRAYDPLDGRESRARQLVAKLEEHFGVQAKGMDAQLDALRLVKQPAEIAAMKRAGRAGALAMAEAIRSTRPGLGEWDLDGLLEFEQVRQGADGPAYHAIVGAGPNSITLHYSASTRRIHDGEMLCVDAGPELDHYTTDITRSWPVNGRFSERQAELYDAVAAAQVAGLAQCKPGNLISDVDAAANQVLIDRGFGDMIRHGVCHWIGMEVHDVGNYATRLAPGMAFTVEPGLYESATNIGIRIEDVVVITPNGYENITRDVPVERAAIEALMAEVGVLER